jgi:hypothetical protein
MIMIITITIKMTMIVMNMTTATQLLFCIAVNYCLQRKVSRCYFYGNFRTRDGHAITAALQQNIRQRT